MSDTPTPALEPRRTPERAPAPAHPPAVAVPVEGAVEDAGRQPTAAQLLAGFGEADFSVQSLFRFVFIPAGRLGFLKELARDEDWGDKEFVLLRYLALHLPLEIEQGRFEWNDEQLVLAAGELTTVGGAPIYVGLVRNSNPQDNPWVMNWVGERPSTSEPPEPAELGAWPALDPGAEVVCSFDLADADRRTRLADADGAGPIAQVSALCGAVSWALHRRLAVRQLHAGTRGYFVPVYLSQREDLTLAPDHVAPIVCQSRRVIVRELLGSHVAYPPARAIVERWEQLPTWLIESWDSAMEAASGAKSTTTDASEGVEA